MISHVHANWPELYFSHEWQVPFFFTRKDTAFDFYGILAIKGGRNVTHDAVRFFVGLPLLPQ